MDVAGHNIANANVVGYSRQRALLAPTDPYAAPTFVRSGVPGQVGTGVAVTAIRRLQSAFLENQARFVAAESGSWDRRFEALSRLEALTNEPGDAGLHALLDRFWGSWQELSANPASTSLRQGTAQAASSLADGFNRIDRQIRELQANADDSIRADIHRINALADQINGLNQAIRLAVGSGDSPNDLLDQRDIILRELASLANTAVRDNGDGSASVSLGGYDLVQQFGVNYLSALTQAGTGYAEIVWADTGASAAIRSGTLAGSIEMRDSIYGAFLADLDRLANAVADRTNELHRTGYDLRQPPQAGADFFDTAAAGARGLRLSPAVAADLSLIAASGDGETGNGQIAVQIARIRHERLGALDQASADDYYRSLVAKLAVRGQEAERAIHTQHALSRQIENQRSQESGVSLDEEMVELMKHQHVYNAAARLLTAMDEMVLTLIERTGAR
jgi:flagellar hook-associated protein 1 FlgK